MDNIPEHWGDLSDEQREALLELAAGRLFWKQAWARLGWLKTLGTVLLTLAAALTLGRDALAKWLMAQ